MSPETPRAYLLDLDGTLYAGGAAVPGAAETLQRLRRQQTPFRLVTNTTSRSRSGIVGRMAGYGIDVSEPEVFTATLAGAEAARELLKAEVRKAATPPPSSWFNDRTALMYRSPWRPSTRPWNS